MQISDLIDQLEDIKQRHGNLCVKVEVAPDDYYNKPAELVDCDKYDIAIRREDGCIVLDTYYFGNN